MGGKENYNDYAITQGGVGNVVADPTPPTATAMSGRPSPLGRPSRMGRSHAQSPRPLAGPRQ